MSLLVMNNIHQPGWTRNICIGLLFCSRVVITLVILFWGIYTDATMHEVGLIFVISESIFFLLNVAIFAKMGWRRKYYPGMIHTFALKVSNAALVAFCAND